MVFMTAEVLPLVTESSFSDEKLAQFDKLRRLFEARLAELGPEAASRFQPIADWMRLVVAHSDPGLLMN
jgi:hypothetical protein